MTHDPRKRKRKLPRGPYLKVDRGDRHNTARRSRSNGECHTFGFDGPTFRESVPVALGAVVQRNAWCFCDLCSPGERE